MIRCLIVDDEPLARRVLERLLEPVKDCRVVASCGSAREALDVLEQAPVDLLFLDIQMPELTGLDLVPLLSPRPAVIFTTAHREFAVEGFELEALDYLLKPVSAARLVKALDRYRDTQRTPGLPHITLRVDRQNVHLRTEDILFIEGMRDYVQVHTTSGTMVTKRALADLEDELSDAGFIRVHHSFLVRHAAISAHSAEFVLVQGKRLPIGRAYRQDALARLGGL